MYSGLVSGQDVLVHDFVLHWDFQLEHAASSWAPQTPQLLRSTPLTLEEENNHQKQRAVQGNKSALRGF